MPSVRAVRPEGTYLMWLDFREWPMTHEQTYRLLIDRAGLGVNEGSMFGEQGRGWMRFNIASPRRVIEQAMDRLYRAAAAERAGRSGHSEPIGHRTREYFLRRAGTGSAGAYRQ